MPITNEVWTAREFNEYTNGAKKPKEAKPSKYKNTKVEHDGKVFDSKKEYAHYLTLVALQNAGEISELNHHVTFTFVHNGMKIGAYEADFTYNKDGKEVVEDVKSKITAKLPVYRLKKKMMEAFYGIKIQEV